MHHNAWYATYRKWYYCFMNVGKAMMKGAIPHALEWVIWWIDRNGNTDWWRLQGVDGIEKDVIADLQDKKDKKERSSKAKQSDEDGDASILRELFDGKGLHSALNHHAIESANDPARIHAERNATKVAERAVLALQQSRQQVRQQPVHLYACLPVLFLTQNRMYISSKKASNWTQNPRTLTIRESLDSWVLC